MNRPAERPDDGRKTVLIVEDDPGTQRVLASGLATSLGMFDVLTANHGKEAVELLESHAIDVVVTDLAMPVMDGFALIGYLTNRGTTLPVVVLSALAPTTVADGLDGYGGLTVLRKPAGYTEVARAVLEALERHDLGQVAGIPLASVLQLVEAERRTCTLAITSGRRRGRLHFESGRLIDAFSDDFGADGEAAAYDILTWTRTAIEFDRLSEGVRRTIDMPVQTLLIEVARRQDAQREREATVTPPLPIPPARTGALDAPEPFREPPAAPDRPAAADPERAPLLAAAMAPEPARDLAPEPEPNPAPEADPEPAPERDPSPAPEAAPEPTLHHASAHPAASAPQPSSAGAEAAVPDTLFAPTSARIGGAPSTAAPSAQPSAPSAAAPDPGGAALRSPEPHAELVTAIDRLTNRVQLADAALAAVADEVDAFRAAQQRYDDAARRQEERRRAVAAARRDVADLARQILERMDGLFDAFDGPDAPTHAAGGPANPADPSAR